MAATASPFRSTPSSSTWQHSLPMDGGSHKLAGMSEVDGQAYEKGHANPESGPKKAHLAAQPYIVQKSSQAGSDVTGCQRGLQEKATAICMTSAKRDTTSGILTLARDSPLTAKDVQSLPAEAIAESLEQNQAQSEQALPYETGLC